MGLLKHLLFWPVTGPLFLVDFSLSKVQGVVREELTDDTRIKAELMELQLKLELGDIDDDEYVAQEAILMQQLREVRQWREEFGMGVSGGPVRVQRARAEETVVPDDSADVVKDDDARASSAEEQVAAATESPDRQVAAATEGAPGPAGGDTPAGEERAPRVADPSGGATIEINLDWN